MKRGTVVAAIALVLLLGPETARAQRWVNLGPDGAPVSDLAGSFWNPHVLYAIGNNIPFRTTDGGAHWEPKPLPGSSGRFPIESVAADPFDPATVYVSTFEGIFKSTDGVAGATGVHESRDFGLTWAARSTGLHAIPGPGNQSNDCVTLSSCVAPLNDLVLDIWNPGTMYVGGGTRSVARTTDSGLDWTGAATGLDPRTALSIAASPARPGTLYAGTGEGLFKSSDSGVTWTPTGLGAPDRMVSLVRVDPQNPDVVYAVRVTPSRYSVYELFKSTDGGATWNPLLGWLMFPLESLAIAPSDPSVIYGAIPSRLMRSLDGGTTWETLSIAGVIVRTLAVDPWTQTTVYAAGDIGSEAVVFKSVDAGVTWTRITDRLLEALGGFTYVRTLAVHPWFPNLLYAGTDAGVALLIQ